MAVLCADESSWAAGVASRLKLLQVSCADDPVEQQKAMIAEEVRRALVDIPKDRRRSYLSALSHWFPGLPNSHVTVPVETKPGIAEASTDEVVQRLFELLPEMSDSEKQKLVVRLRDTKLIPTERKAHQWKAAEEFQKALGLDETRQVDPERLSRLFALLMESLLMVDHLAWVRWTELAPQSGFKKPSGDLRSLCAACLCETNVEQADGQWRQLRELLGGQGGRTIKLLGEMLVALNRTGGKFAQTFLDQLSPARIEDVIGAGGFFGMGNRKAECWDKYTELFRHYSTREAITQKIRESYVRAVEERLGNRHASPG